MEDKLIQELNEAGPKHFYDSEYSNSDICDENCVCDCHMFVGGSGESCDWCKQHMCQSPQYSKVKLTCPHCLKEFGVSVVYKPYII
jgi:hypothetical protein